MQLDRIDRKIIAALMEDATVPLARLADSVGLTATPCWKRVQRLTRDGVIRGRVALVDPERIGLTMTAFVEVSAPDQSEAWRVAFLDLVADLPEVMDAYQLSGEPDYVLRVVARDMADFDRIRQVIVSSIPLRGLTTSFALKTLKSETVLPLDTRTA